MAFKFANFFVGELLSAVSSGATTIMIHPSQADNLPEIILGSDDEIRLVLWDGQNEPEIVGCVENDFSGVLTVVRALEGTTAQFWNAGTQVVSALTKEVIEQALSVIVDVTTVGDLRYVRKQGDVMTGHLGLPSGTPASTQATRRDYVEGLIVGFVQTSGFTMTGNINMDAHRILNLAPALVDAEPATFGQLSDIQEALTNRLADLSGQLFTTNTSLAYNLTSVSVITALVDGLRMSFRVHTQNSTGATLNLNSLGAKQLRTIAGTPIEAGILVSKIPYTAIYSGIDDAWYLEGLYGTGWQAPAGTLMIYGGTVAPSGFLLPTGQVLSQSTYQRLYDAIGGGFNDGSEGAGNFRVPDCRGRFPSFRDTIGAPAGRLTAAGGGVNAVVVGAAGGQQTQTLAVGHMPNYFLAHTLGVSEGAITVTTTTGIPGNARSAGLVSPGGVAGGFPNCLQWDAGQIVASQAGSSITGSIWSGGSAVPLSVVPPTLVFTPILKY